MARSDEDIINCSFNLTGEISLDIERILEDPVWKMLCLQIGLNNEEFYPELLSEYLSYYIVREKFLSEMPVTNGPGTVKLIGTN